MRDELTALHKKEYGSTPTVIVSAPGKINLLGEHTEFGQGMSLSFGTDKRFMVGLSARSDNSLRFYSGTLKERKKTTLAGLKFKREDRWANYTKGVMDALVRMGCTLKGMNFTFMSDIPIGIGLASSAAMTIASVVAIKTLLDLELSDAQVIEAARQAEHRFMGLEEGITAPMVSYYAQADRLLYLDSRSLKVEHLPGLGEGVSILITDSRVSESMTNEEKAGFRQSCQDCVDALGRSTLGFSFRELTREDMAGSIQGLSERSRRICLHILEENRRVRDMRRAILDGRVEDLGRLMVRSHESLRDMLEVSCPELDWLAKRAVETPGVFGARMIGDGYGGCTVTVMDDKFRAGFEERLEEYDRIFGFKARVFPVVPGEGVRIHLPEIET